MPIFTSSSVAGYSSTSQRGSDWAETPPIAAWSIHSMFNIIYRLDGESRCLQDLDHCGNQSIDALSAKCEGVYSVLSESRTPRSDQSDYRTSSSYSPIETYTLLFAEKCKRQSVQRKPYKALAPGKQPCRKPQPKHAWQMFM